MTEEEGSNAPLLPPVAHWGHYNGRPASQKSDLTKTGQKHDQSSSLHKEHNPPGLSPFIEIVFRVFIDIYVKAFQSSSEDDVEKASPQLHTCQGT